MGQVNVRHQAMRWWAGRVSSGEVGQVKSRGMGDGMEISGQAELVTVRWVRPELENE